MPSINDLEMARAIASHPNITIRRTLFSRRATYTPTASRVRVVSREYTPSDGDRMMRLLALPLESIAAELKAKGVPPTTPVGHYRLEACVSDDRQFCALQMFRFVDFRFTPAIEPLFYEGDEAALAAQLLD